MAPAVPLSELAPERGTYRQPGPSDVRGPCPMLNTLANHGYIPRDGRNVRASEITAALHDVVGVSSTVTLPFTHPIFFEHREAKAAGQAPSLWSRAWSIICLPSKLIFRWGMRRHGQFDSATGKKCLDLDQLGIPNAIEHDISLTRLDAKQGDNMTPQPGLIRDLLASSSDGGKTLSAADLAGVRLRRIAAQREANPDAVYGRMQHSFACMEIALFLGVFGDGKKVKCDYARAFFQEERLPFEEGWSRRPWWRRLGWLELGWTAARVRRLVGIKV
ncbi:Chloroperoxidase [Echria macrotheca]|uniref:Chloroperoxidase n=1 Tax=Echria macrotheca TaxID=438768 RepID=A0AAJ0BEA4_9PEZI|nr:Chloroperoxidase [Echria macrotheca]